MTGVPEGHRLCGKIIPAPFEASPRQRTAAEKATARISGLKARTKLLAEQGQAELDAGAPAVS
jgi:hypothetical protein